MDVAASAVLVVLAATTADRLTKHDRFVVSRWVNAFGFWWYLPAYVLAVYFVVRRAWVGAAVSLGIALLHVRWTVPVRSRREPRESASATFTVVSANVKVDNDDPEAMVAELAALSPDILLIQEYSPEWASLFRHEGLASGYAHVIEAPKNDSKGSAVYSRFGLRDVEVWPCEGTMMVTAVAEGPGGDITVFNLHPVPPRARAERQWPEIIRRVEAARGDVLVAGDLNLTPQNAWYRRLLATGVRDCHTQRGRPWVTTWPNRVFLLPPIKLDHMFTGGRLRCASIREGAGPGSDHRPLIATLGWE